MIIFQAIGALIALFFRLVATALKVIYRILKFFRIRLLTLYLVVCGLLQLCFHTFEGFAVTYFWIGVAACAAVTLYGWTSRAREKARRRELARRERGEAEREKRERGNKREERVESTREERASAPETPAFMPRAQYPQYFEVEGHEGFMFAEYEDRYELFRREASGWTYIRTDYKEDNT